MQLREVVSTAPPAAGADGTSVVARGLKYRELAAQVFGPAGAAAAPLPAYFVMDTFSGGIEGVITDAAQSAFSATKFIFMLHNSDRTGSRRLMLDFVRINFGTAGTGGTRTHFAVSIDRQRTAEIAGSSAIGTDGQMFPPDASSGPALSGAPYRNSTAIAASANVRYLYTGTFSPANITDGENYYLDFAGDYTGSINDRVAYAGPVVLGQSDTMLLHFWRPGQTAAPTGTINAGWWEL